MLHNNVETWALHRRGPEAHSKTGRVDRQNKKQAGAWLVTSDSRTAAKMPANDKILVGLLSISATGKPCRRTPKYHRGMKFSVKLRIPTVFDTS